MSDVAIFDAQMRPAFAGAQIVKAAPVVASKTMEHPLESGAVVTDHRIILPVSIELSLLLVSSDYTSVYQLIAKAYAAGDLFTVQTRVDTHRNLVIDKMPREESADVASGVTVALTFKEVKIVTSTFTQAKTKSAKDSKTKKQGQQQPKESPPERKTSILGSLFK